MSDTHILTLLLEKKATLFTHPSNPVAKYKECWSMFFDQLPQMYKLGENWIYYHRQMEQMSCGKNDQIAIEFASLQYQGLTRCDDSKINEKKVFVIIPHPKKKKTGLRADLTFHRFLGEEDAQGNCKGAGLCPLLFGLGCYGDGFTYVNVKFSEVPLTKEMGSLTLDLINQKW